MGAVPKFPRRKKQDDVSAASTEQTQGPAPNGRVPCQEQNHADDEVVPPNGFPFVEVFPAFAGADFDPDTLNIFTGRLFGNKHHVKHEGAKTKNHFLAFKCCFCLEWKLVKINGKWYWVRCGNMFNLLSPGCIEHPRSSYMDGPNRIYPLLAAGKEGTWGILKNLHIDQEDAPAPDGQKLSKDHDDLNTLGEMMAAASIKGQDTQQLQATFQARTQKMSRARKEAGSCKQGPAVLHRNVLGKAAPVASADSFVNQAAPVYGSRRRIGDSAPGIPVLDQKRAASNNGTKKFRSNAPFSTLAPLPEDGKPTERRKPRKKDKGAGGAGLGPQS